MGTSEIMHEAVDGLEYLHLEGTTTYSGHEPKDEDLESTSGTEALRRLHAVNRSVV